MNTDKTSMNRAMGESSAFGHRVSLNMFLIYLCKSVSICG